MWESPPGRGRGLKSLEKRKVKFLKTNVSQQVFPSHDITRKFITERASGGENSRKGIKGW